MAAGGILRVKVRHIAGRKGAVQQHRIAVVHHRVVHAVKQENRRRIGLHVLFQRERIPHLLFQDRPFSQQAQPGTLMHQRGILRDNRVNGCYKIRPQGHFRFNPVPGQEIGPIELGR